jgi:hypothetical protein
MAEPAPSSKMLGQMPAHETVVLHRPWKRISSAHPVSPFLGDSHCDFSYLVMLASYRHKKTRSNCQPQGVHDIL